MTSAPPARYATRRTPTLPTGGRRAAGMSLALGAPFMPWQRQVADVALEAHPLVPGAMRYPLVVVTVPRQSGKTTLLRAVAMVRAMSRPRHEVVYTAQTGKDARKQWRAWCSAITEPPSPFAGVAHLRRSQGSEALTLPNSSSVAPFTPAPKSLHGSSPPTVFVDEAWSFDEELAVDLMGAITPAQITLLDRQLWIVSTMGDARSTWWNGLVEQGRASVDDPNATMAYFEWSADPVRAGLDPYGVDTLQFHPALGHTQTVDSLLETAHNGSTPPGEWLRAFLNLQAAVDTTVVDLATFDELQDSAHDLDPTEAVVSYAVARDRSGATVYGAHPHPTTGRPCLHFIRTGPGASWLVDAVAQLHKRAREVVVDDSGHTRPITRALAARGVHPRKLTPGEWATASTALLGDVADSTMHHDGATELRDALQVAATSPLAGGIAFSDKRSRGNTDALRAATVAAFAVRDTNTAPPIF